MTMIERLARWRETGIINDAQHGTLSALVQRQRMSVFFELNGIPREVSVQDRAQQPTSPQAMKADPSDPRQIGASMPGMVVTIAVQVGDPVKKGQTVLSLEAMKMETTLHAEVSGIVAQVLVQPGSQVDAGDLLIRIE